jgi:hypothetical protein
LHHLGQDDPDLHELLPLQSTTASKTAPDKFAELSGDAVDLLADMAAPTD